jgi:16S rRNA pseudouridine516 synthase
MRLDRFLIRRGIHSTREVSRLLSEKQVIVDHLVETSGLRKIDRFTRIEVNGEILQAQEAVYLMLHKPAGYLSATSDPIHPTVIDLIEHPLREQIHLAGRLDRASTGLVLLTNDGRWSKRVTEPRQQVAKVYQVTTLDPISAETAAIFASGVYFAYENLTTRPAVLELLGEREARLTLHEGRYHQVKRMFHAVGNRVLSLHREQIGPLTLDASLPPGKARSLRPDEINFFRL